MRKLFIPKEEKKTDKISVLEAEIEGEESCKTIIIKNDKNRIIGFVAIDCGIFDGKYVMVDNQLDQFGETATTLKELLQRNNHLDFFLLD